MQSTYGRPSDSEYDWPDREPPDSTSTAPGAQPRQRTPATKSDERSPSTSRTTGKSSGSATTTTNTPERRLLPEHRDRLKERSLDPTLCEQLGVWSADKGTLAFDYRVNNNVHNTKMRRGKGNMPWAIRDVELILWNVDSLREEPAPDEFVIITEGEFDAIANIQCGFTRVVSVPNGAQQSESGFKFLLRGNGLIPDLAKFDQFILAFDNDAPGLAARDAVAMLLGDERCRHVTYPAGCKDSNDVLKLKGADALRACIENARPMWTDEIASIDDIPEPPEEIQYKIGIREIDEHGFRITLPALWVLLGPYSSGKSVLLRQLVCNFYELYGWRCLLTSFEERVKPRYQRDLRRHFIGRSMWLRDEPWTDEEIEAADDKIRGGFRFLRRARGKPLDLTRLLDRIEFAAKVHGVKCVAVDPVNEVDISVDRGGMKTDVLGSFLRDLKDLGEDYGLLTILCAHTAPGKTERKLSKGGLLTLYDGEDTRHWGGKSDIGWVMWRNVDGPSMLHMERTKDHETMGKPTLAELELQRGLNRFEVKRMGYDILRKRPEKDDD